MAQEYARTDSGGWERVDRTGPGGAVLLGDRELRELLKHLPDRVYRKVVRQVTSKMAAPILRAARVNLRAKQSVEARDILAASLKKKTKTYQHNGAVVTVIGAAWPKGAHAHLVEKGHRMVTASGTVVGFVPAMPFVRPAFDANKGKVMQIAAKALRVGVEREAKKLAKT